MSASFFFRPARISIGLRRVLALLALVPVFGLSTASDAVAANTGAGSGVGVGYSFCVVGNPSICGNGPDGAAAGAAAQANATDPSCGGGCGYAFDYTNGSTYYYFITLNGGHNGSFGVTQQFGVCASGYVLQPDGTCKSNQPSCPAVGAPAPGGNTANGTSPTQTIINPQVCVGGCAYTYSSYWTGARPGQSGGFPAQYTGLQSTGNSCDGSGTPTASTPAPPTPDNPCTQRQYYGTVNGQPKCVDYPTNTTGGTTSSTTTDAPASSPAASSSSTTTSSTTCDGTTCTTTTVVVGGGGGVGGGPGGNGGASGVSASPCASGQVSTGAQVNGGPGTCTTTTTQPQDEYCKQNPTADQCGNKSQWGGDCTAGFTCKGDAVVCAISQVQYKQYCDAQQLAHAPIGKAFFGNDTLSPDESQLEAEMKALNPQDKTTGIGDNDIDVGKRWQTALNDVSKKLTVFGGASCPAGNTITFMQITVTVPYDIMCQFATVIRGFVTLAAAMVCLRIFGRAD